MKTKNKSLKDGKLFYKKHIQFSLILSLLFCIIIFQAFKKFEYKLNEEDFKIDKTIVEVIPITEQNTPKPPPPKPTIPIESESEEVPDEVTISDNFEFDPAAVPDPPAPPVLESGESTDFIVYDEAPEPIGGFAAIARNLVYPELARKAGIEGTVVVKVKIDKRGEVVETKILVPLGNSGCNEAAIAAIKSVKWKPAYQRDIPVTVWVSMPVNFRLK